MGAPFDSMEGEPLLLEATPDQVLDVGGHRYFREDFHVESLRRLGESVGVDVIHHTEGHREDSEP